MKKMLTGILALLMVSCSNIYYISDPNEGLNASLYNSYNTEESCDEEISRLNMQRIKNAVDISMRDIGYAKSENPDVLVKYFVKSQTKEQYIQECTNHYSRWIRGMICRERVLTYEEGSIVIDIIDTQTNTIIWHGAVRGPSFDSFSRPNQDINRMVKKLIAMYFSHQSLSEKGSGRVIL